MKMKKLSPEDIKKMLAHKGDIRATMNALGIESVRVVSCLRYMAKKKTKLDKETYAQYLKKGGMPVKPDRKFGKNAESIDIKLSLAETGDVKKTAKKLRIEWKRVSTTLMWMAKRKTPLDNNYYNKYLKNGGKPSGLMQNVKAKVKPKRKLTPLPFKNMVTGVSLPMLDGLIKIPDDKFKLIDRQEKFYHQLSMTGDIEGTAKACGLNRQTKKAWLIAFKVASPNKYNEFQVARERFKGVVVQKQIRKKDKTPIQTVSSMIDRERGERECEPGKMLDEAIEQLKYSKMMPEYKNQIKELAFKEGIKSILSLQKLGENSLLALLYQMINQYFKTVSPAMKYEDFYGNEDDALEQFLIDE